MAAIPRTYAEAIKQGYRDGETRWARGYISRKCKLSETPVRVAGGTRKGQLYVDLPSYRSTNYHIRQYLI